MKRQSTRQTSYWYEELDPITAMAPTTSYSTFYKQMVNDPVIGGILFHFRTLIKQAKFTQKGKVVSDKVFNQIIDDFFDSIVYGVYCGEILWNRNGIEDVVPIHPQSITEIDNETGKIIQEDGAEIKISKCITFTMFSEGRNPYGLSLLRHVYKPWYLKSLVENHDLVMTERAFRGLPVFTAPEGFNFAAADTTYPGYDASTAATLTIMTTMAGNIYDGKQKGAVLPDGWTLELLGHDPHVNIEEKFKRYNTEICTGLLDNFLMATARGTENLSDIFVDSINFFVKKYVDALNNDLVPVAKKLGVKDAGFDVFVGRSYDLNGLASYLTRLGKNEMIEINGDLKEKCKIMAGF